MTTNAAIIWNQHIDCNEGIYDFQYYNADAIFFSFKRPVFKRFKRKHPDFLHRRQQQGILNTFIGESPAQLITYDFI